MTGIVFLLHYYGRWWLKVKKDLFVLQHCSGQTYNRASNMTEKKSVVTTKLLVEQPLVTHCQGHSLSSAVKCLTTSCKILCDTMSKATEICILVKYSQKRENILRRMKEKSEGNFDPDPYKILALEKFCPTRCTVRASCFQKIIENYCLLLEIWDECLKESLDVESRSRIIGRKSLMRTLTFFLDLCLSQRRYSLTENLSKTLKKEKMSAVSAWALSSFFDSKSHSKYEKRFRFWFISTNS